jgi:pimeloyl-ACP methyl ester carboxylesterase
VPGYAAHLGRCLEALGITRAHLVLHDFGGPWGLAWAATHPAAFASATLVNIGIRRSEAPGLPVSHRGCVPRLSTWDSEAGGRPVSSATASDIVSQRPCRMDSNMVV